MLGAVYALAASTFATGCKDAATEAGSMLADASEVDGSVAAAPYSPSEMTVIVYETAFDETIPLEGAIVSVAQAGQIVSHETGKDGRATASVQPEGGPLLVSVQHSGYVASSWVGYDRALHHAEIEASGTFAVVLTPLRPLTVNISGRAQRAQPDSYLTAWSSTVPQGEAKQQDDFFVSAVAGRPFNLTLIEQLSGQTATPASGWKVPVTSWRTLEHAGAEEDLSLATPTWSISSLSKRRVSVVRATALTLANDEAIAYVIAWDLTRAGEAIKVAETSDVAPWQGKTRYEVELTGPAELIRNDALLTQATIFNADGFSSTIHLRGAVPTRVDGPFLSPPVAADVAPAMKDVLAWRGDDKTLWSFLSASDVSGLLLWQVQGWPGVSSLDMSELLATLPAADFNAYDLNAVLTLCDAQRVSTECSRTAASPVFRLADLK